MRRLILGTVAAVLVFGGALALPQRVSAHALRQSSVPTDGAVLDSAPTEVLITFGEEPDPRLSHIDVLDTAGAAHQQGPLTAVPGNPRELRVAVGPLSKGVYTVSWSTVSAVDGHRAAGSFAFGIGVTAQQVQTAATGGAGQSESYSGRPSVLTVAGRWALYLGLFGLTGAVFVGALVLPAAPRSQLVMAVAGLGVALAGTALVIGVEIADAGVGLGDLLGSSLGRASIERIASMLASAAAVGTALWSHGRRRRIALIVAGGCAAAAMLVDVGASHAAAADSLVIVNIALQWFHILAAATWIGGLAGLLLALRDPQVAGGRGTAVKRFSTGAGIALGVVLVTGVIRAAVEIASWGSVLTTDFGRLVIVKLGLIAVLAALGGINRWRHVGRIPARLSGLRRVGSGELAVASLAVLVASALVNVAPPVSAGGSSAPAPLPPLEVTAGDYATTVKVTLTVSPGTAGFNDFTARVADYDSGAPVDASGVQLRFSLPIAPDVGASTLTLSRAGPGVFSARGGNLSLDGSWKVTALVQRGAQSVEVPLSVATRSPQQRIDVTRVAGEPVYTIHLSGNRTVQVYVDPPGPGKVDVHATFFDAAGNGLPMMTCMIVGTPPSGQPEAYPVRLFDVGHYIASAGVVRGAYRFDIAAVTASGERLTTHLDTTVPAS